MRKCRISQSKQDRLIEHFIAGTTARTAASLVGVHRNIAAFFFHRLREVIAYELEAESEACSVARLRLTRATLGFARKANAEPALLGKSLHSVYSSVVEKFIHA